MSTFLHPGRRYRPLLHVLFWGTYFLFCIWIYRSSYMSIWPLLQVTTCYLLGNALLFYTVQYRILPAAIKGYWIRGAVTYLFLLVSLSLLQQQAIARVLQPWPVMYQYVVREAYLMGIVMSNVMIPGLLMGAKSVVERLQEQRRNRRIERQRLEQELRFLKAQVNPHFLFNAINSVYVLIRLDPQRAADTLLKLSDLLRIQLYEFQTEQVPIERELEYLRHYMDLEQVRRGNRLQLSFEMEGALEGFSLPPFLLLPFLENCFKHLSAHTDRPNRVAVTVTRKDGSLQAHFCNTFEQDPSRLGGIGMQNVRRRLELLYEGAYFLSAEQRADEYHVHLEIPVL